MRFNTLIALLVSFIFATSAQAAYMVPPAYSSAPAYASAPAYSSAPAYPTAPAYATGTASPSGYWPGGNGTYNKPTGTGLMPSATQSIVPPISNGASSRLSGSAFGVLALGGIALIL